MNIHTVLKLNFGGPGSGCNGPNCGRPAGHSGKHEPKKLGPNPGVSWNWKKYGHLVKEGERPRALSPFEMENRYKHSLTPTDDELKSLKSLEKKAGVDREFVTNMHDALTREDTVSAKRHFSFLPKEIQKKVPERIQELMKVTKKTEYDDDPVGDDE